MKVKKLLDLVELRLQQADLTLTVHKPDRFVLEEFLAHSINRILEMEEWSFGVKMLDPLFQTETGKRTYLLPADFPATFLRGGHDGMSYVCHISDGTSDSALYYESPEKFFSRERTSVSNTQPEHYTITTQGNRKQIHLDPPPDSNSDSHYTIWGAYRPIWDGESVNEDTDILIPNHSVVLFDVLQMVEPRPEWARGYAEGLQSLYNQEAKAKKPKMAPSYSDRKGYGNYYDTMREWSTR